MAIETSTVVARVVVVDAGSGRRLAAAEALAERHSSNLLRLCVETTERAGVAVARLGGIACGAGPGSFTGLRVGLAVAKGLAMPTDIPLVLVSSLEALAMDMLPHALPGEWLVPCLDAGKGQVYAGLFEPAPAVGTDRMAETELPTVIRRTEEWVVTPGALLAHLPIETPVLGAGPGALRYRVELLAGLGGRGRIAEIHGPTADSVAALARRRLDRGERDDLGTAVPAYGRLPDITPPRRRTP